MKRIAIIGGLLILAPAALWIWNEYKYRGAQEACVVSVFEDYSGNYLHYRECMVNVGYPLETLQGFLRQGSAAANRLQEHIARLDEEVEARNQMNLEDQRQRLESERKEAELRRQKWEAEQAAIEVRTAAIVEEARKYPLGMDFKKSLSALIEQIKAKLAAHEEHIYRKQIPVGILLDNQLDYSRRTIDAKWNNADPSDVFTFIRGGIDSAYQKGSEHFKDCLKAKAAFQQRFLDSLVKAYPSLTGEADRERVLIDRQLMTCDAAKWPKTK